MLATSGAGRVRWRLGCEGETGRMARHRHRRPIASGRVRGAFAYRPVPHDARTELAGPADLGFRMVLDGELVSVGNDDNVDFLALGQRM